MIFACILGANDSKAVLFGTLILSAKMTNSKKWAIFGAK